MPRDSRFVLDTNIIISALLLKESVARQAFDKARAEGTILVSQATIEELNNVIHRPGFDRYILEDERIQFITAFVLEATFVEITEAITGCRDQKDDKFLEVAVNGQATIIISGDNDLLSLTSFRKIPVLTPRQFLERSY